MQNIGSVRISQVVSERSRMAGYYSPVTFAMKSALEASSLRLAFPYWFRPGINGICHWIIDALVE
jgi:hypothetical protein